MLKIARFSCKNGGVCLSFGYLDILFNMHIMNELRLSFRSMKVGICGTRGGVAIFAWPFPGPSARSGIICPVVLPALPISIVSRNRIIPRKRPIPSPGLENFWKWCGPELRLLLPKGDPRLGWGGTRRKLDVYGSRSRIQFLPCSRRILRKTRSMGPVPTGLRTNCWLRSPRVETRG